MYYDKTELIKRLGINRDFKSWNSYSKHLNSNSVLAYDCDSIYLVDKLSITYETQYHSSHFSHLKNYANDFHFTYNLNDRIELRKEVVSKYYHHSYTIIISGEIFGSIHIRHTSCYNGVRIDIENQVLYQKSKLDILLNLYELAVQLDLTFKNVSEIEIARDSATNYYDRFCKIQYQSDFCPSQIYDIYNSKPKFSCLRKRLQISHEVDSRNTAFGTVRIGSNGSDTQVKLYVKSNELKSWNDEKNYISAIHAKHFQNSSIVSRVEVRGNSKAVRKRNWDLLDLLTPEKHKAQFFELLDDKLKFKKLESMRWDTNRNKKFDVLDLLPNDVLGSDITTIPLESSCRLTHLKNTNKMKAMIYMYLDNELSTWGIIDFFRNNIWGKPVSYKKYHAEVEKAIKNYKNPKGRGFRKKIQLVKKLMESNGSAIAVAKILISLWL